MVLGFPLAILSFQALLFLPDQAWHKVDYRWTEVHDAEIGCGQGQCLPPAPEYGCTESEPFPKECIWHSVEEAEYYCEQYWKCKSFWCSNRYKGEGLLCFARSSIVPTRYHPGDVIFRKMISRQRELIACFAIVFILGKFYSACVACALDKFTLALMLLMLMLTDAVS